MLLYVPCLIVPVCACAWLCVCVRYRDMVASLPLDRACFALVDLTNCPGLPDIVPLRSLELGRVRATRTQETKAKEKRPPAAVLNATGHGGGDPSFNVSVFSI